MAGETILHIRGNLVADPELRYTTNGLAVASFTVASTPRIFDKQANEWKDQDALFMRCSAWRELGEHIAATLTKGSAVMVEGYLRQRSYQTREGEQRTSIELDVQDAGPSLKYATAAVTRTSGGNGSQDERRRQLRGQQQGGQQGGGMRPGTAGDQGGQPQGGGQGQGAWTEQGGGYEDETPW